MLPDASLCVQCAGRSNNTKMLELGAEKGLLQSHAQKWVAYALKKILSSPKLLAKAFYRKGEEGGIISCFRLLGVRSFVLEVKLPCSCKSPKKKMVFFVLERKAEVPVLNFCPPRSRSWLKRGGPYVGPVWERSSNTQPGSFCRSLVWLKRQISAGRILRARFPDPAQSLSLRGQGTWDPASSQAFHLSWRGSEAFTAYDPWRLLPPLGCRGEDWGEIHCCFKAWSSQLMAVGRALELCRTQPSTCLLAFPAYLLAPRAWEKAAIRLSPQSLSQNHCWLTVGGMGPLTTTCYLLHANSRVLLHPYSSGRHTCRSESHWPSGRRGMPPPCLLPTACFTFLS